MNDTARTPTAEPNPDSAPPRPNFRPDLIGRILDRAARQARMYGRVCLPSRLADTDLHMALYGRTCQIIDDPIDPGSERYQQARAGVPYPRGTRAQRRRTATARVQARRRKVRTLRRYLGEWFQKTVEDKLSATISKAYSEMADYSAKLAWEGVPAGPYDPVLSPGYTATCVVTCV